MEDMKDLFYNGKSNFYNFAEFANEIFASLERWVLKNPKWSEIGGWAYFNNHTSFLLIL